MIIFLSKSSKFSAYVSWTVINNSIPLYSENNDTNMLKLIKKYKVFGRTYNINYVKEVLWTEIKKGGKKKTEELEGECLATFQTINVATHDPFDKKNGEQITKPIHPERMHQTSCHEIIHSWLNESGYLKLDADEVFVQQMGNCLAEFLRTAEHISPKDL